MGETESNNMGCGSSSEIKMGCGTGTPQSTGSEAHVKKEQHWFRGAQPDNTAACSDTSSETHEHTESVWDGGLSPPESFGGTAITESIHISSIIKERDPRVLEGSTQLRPVRSDEYAVNGRHVWRVLVEGNNAMYVGVASG